MPRPAERYTTKINRLHGDQSVSKTMIVALQIAKRYQARPSAEDLMRDFSMSRATAYRWRAAWQYVCNDASAV